MCVFVFVFVCIMHHMCMYMCVRNAIQRMEHVDVYMCVLSTMQYLAYNAAHGATRYGYVCFESKCSALCVIVFEYGFDLVHVNSESSYGTFDF